jgi:hypothetical protein
MAFSSLDRSTARYRSTRQSNHEKAAGFKLCAALPHSPVNVRFGSLADIEARPPDVRLYPQKRTLPGVA